MPDLLTETINSELAREIRRLASIQNASDHVTLVGDGVVDNADAFFEQLGPALKQQNPGFPVTVTMTIASPAVVTWTGHRHQVNDAVVFSTSGALPTGVVAGTTYYVLSAGLTADVFRISLTNANEAGAEGSAVNTSGSQSGTHKARTLGVEWQEVTIPPGSYNNSNVPTISGSRRARYLCYGVNTNDIQGSGGGYAQSFAGTYPNYALINTALARDSSVTLVTAADNTKFYIGCWVLVAALDLQNPFGSEQSTPLNNHFFEFKRVTGINAGTGVLTLEEKLRHTYKSTYPQMWAGNGSTRPSGGGKASIFCMHPRWDVDWEFHGLHLIRSNQSIFTGRSIKLVDCRVTGSGDVGFIPTMSKSWVAERLVWDNPSNAIEVDKEIAYLRYTECRVNTLHVQSSSVDRFVVEGGAYENLKGTGKRGQIRDADIAEFWPGTYSFGASETLLVENSRIGLVHADDSLVANTGVNKFHNLVSRFAFSEGRLSVPLASSPPNDWAVPGQKVFVNDLAGTYRSMGRPFTILDVRDDGTDFIIDTTLSALPTAANNTSATVTITIASPGVVTWNAHGLAANTPVILKTTGALPTGLTVANLAGTTGAVYYVRNPAANTFELSATSGGASINTSGSQSGTHTAEANPLHFQIQAVSSITVRNCTGCPEIVDLSHAPEGAPWSYTKRVISSGLFTAGGLQSHLRAPILRGNLSRLRVNVLRPYTGATGTFTLTISSNAFDANLAASNLSQVINLKTAGERNVYPGSITGAVAGDTLAATSVWLSDDFRYTTSSSPAESLEKFPIVEIECWTDQGELKPGAMAIRANPNETTPKYLVDSNLMF